MTVETEVGLMLSHMTFPGHKTGKVMTFPVPGHKTETVMNFPVLGQKTGKVCRSTMPESDLLMINVETEVGLILSHMTFPVPVPGQKTENVMTFLVPGWKIGKLMTFLVPSQKTGKVMTFQVPGQKTGKVIIFPVPGRKTGKVIIFPVPGQKTGKVCRSTILTLAECGNGSGLDVRSHDFSGSENRKGL